MTKIFTTRTLVFLSAGIAVGGKTQAADKPVKHPNIIFIMSDDHAYQAISAYGHGLNSTPNIDRIGKEGAIFTNSFVTNSLSAPSRAVMLTGKFNFLNGKTDNKEKFDWNQENFPKLLQKAGYQTALIGKIHLEGNPQGFDYSAVLPGQGNYYNPDFIINGVKSRIHGYVTEVTTDLALNWLKQRDPKKPFCLLFHQKAPHREWMPAPKYFKTFTKMKFKEPENFFDNYENRGTAAKTQEMQIDNHMKICSDNKIEPAALPQLGIAKDAAWGQNLYRANKARMDEQQRASWDSIYSPITEEFKKEYPHMSKDDLTHWKYQRYMQDYLACIASVDEAVGEVLDYLDKNGLAENTIVVYTSDQGMYLGEHGWFDKRFMYEESLRTPLLMRYPKEIKPGTKVDKMVQNLDYAPTFLDFAGVTAPSDMQGMSFRKILTNEHSEWRDAIYYTYYEYPSVHMVKRHYGIRTDRYKLIHFYYDINEWELYDLKNDPHEMKNVFNDPAYADIRKMMEKRLAGMRTKYGDSDERDQYFINRYLKSQDPPQLNQE